MHAYYGKEGKEKNLTDAIDELKHHSNPKGSKGIQARREAEALLLESHKSKFYSAPGQPLLPRGPLKVYLPETTIPRGVEAWPSPSIDDKSQKYYIWRTEGDSRVRKKHAGFDGRLFKKGSPIYNASEDAGCRCKRVPVPYELEVMLFAESHYAADQKGLIERKMIVWPTPQTSAA